MRMDAGPLHYRELNELINAAVRDSGGGGTEVELENVTGQRYIGAGLPGGVNITVRGVPGNDLGAFMDGAEIAVHGNAQDGVGNTMNAGRIVIHGRAGDIPGHSMRGGKILIRGDVGYRAGIHMKACYDRFPVLVIGGSTRDYAGEYMAGGILVVMNLGRAPASRKAHYLGTGMHGGTIYLRGPVEPHQLGQEVGVGVCTDEDGEVLEALLSEYRSEFAVHEGFSPDEFTKVVPKTTRPYGTLYAY